MAKIDNAAIQKTGFMAIIFPSKNFRKLRILSTFQGLLMLQLGRVFLWNARKSGYYMGMDSENARFLRQGLIEHCRKMTPQERVRAFIEHSRQMQKIRVAGEARRKALELKKSSHA